MARRRERAAAGPSAVGVELPEHLRDYTGPLVFAEESPEATADTDAARRSRFAAWHAWEADRDRWAVEHGWTRRQVLGYDHPTWVARGWADSPPSASSQATVGGDDGNFANVDPGARLRPVKPAR